MSTYCVYHLIHVRTPHQHVPELFITSVSDKDKVEWDLVDNYCEFGEFNIPHANHVITKLTKDSPPELKRAFRDGECERVEYQALAQFSETIEPEMDPFTKRVRQVRDALNKCKNPDSIEAVAKLLNI